MKRNQALKITFENYVVVTRFDMLDPKLLPLARKLELEGNSFGGQSEFDGTMCVSIDYVEKFIKPVPEAKIFGYPEAEFLAKQYK